MHSPVGRTGNSDMRSSLLDLRSLGVIGTGAH
jgi:hypothetical protein